MILPAPRLQSVPVKGLSWRAVHRTALLHGGVWPSRPPGTGIVQWLFTAPMLWITKLVALLAWKTQNFCLSPVGKWGPCLIGAGHSVKTWLWQWRRSEMTRVIIRLLGGIAWQCSPWKWERLFSADGILLTVSAFSIFKWILVLLQLVWQLLLLFWQAALVCHLSTSAASV